MVKITKPKLTEAQVLKAVLQWFRWNPWAGLAFRVNTGGVWSKERQTFLKSPNVTPGFPDIIVARPIGLTAWLELKSDVGKLSPDQRLFRDAVMQLGHDYHVIRSLDDVENIFKNETVRGRA